MNITFENVDKVSALLTVNIEKADYEDKVKKALKDYSRKASLPGFRPGKVPASLLQKRSARKSRLRKSTRFSARKSTSISARIR